MLIRKYLCVGCGRCQPYCPVGAIHFEEMKSNLDQEVCYECGTCLRSEVCPVEAMGFIVAGALGIIIYYGILVRDLRKQELWKHIHVRKIKFPVKEIFCFSTPLFTSSFVFMVRTHLVVILLEYFRSTLDVASYRAVHPVADLNTTVIQSFALLFMPTMARLYARKDQPGIDHLYWQSAVWITVISFPVFLLRHSR